MIIDSTSAADFLKHLDLVRLRPAEVRVATDISVPPLPPIVKRATAVGSSPESENKSTEVTMSPWLADTMEIISIQRSRPEAQSLLLEDAENVAALVAGASPGRRPQLNILEDGRPSFATSLRGFYIHMTIDRPGRLTWFATANDQEYFGEDVPFDGRRLPKEVRELLSA